ncbi:unnamed protein product, partial [Linum tenue]
MLSCWFLRNTVVELLQRGHYKESDNQRKEIIAERNPFLPPLNWHCSWNRTLHG